MTFDIYGPCVGPKNAYYMALEKCGERYKKMLEDQTKVWSDGHEALQVFVETFIWGCKNNQPLLKLNRWLGYIQECLIERGYTTVADERNWTRPLFRPIDSPEDIVV